MNHDIDLPRFDSAAREREWRMQELASRRERLGLDPAGDDALVRRYRLLARALRQPLHDDLPGDFARRVAAMVATPAVRERERAPGAGLESWLLMSLAIALALAAAVVTTLYGASWLPAFAAIVPAPHRLADRWLLAFAGCVGFSWLLGQWHRHARDL
ncbi:MAG: hypothetical protein KGJ32_05625 [Xanthomonadaceae bacterium]|nr:hypothetical protein [Xanthomonadaceae bacterium]